MRWLQRWLAETNGPAIEDREWWSPALRRLTARMEDYTDRIRFTFTDRRDAQALFDRLTAESPPGESSPYSLAGDSISIYAADKDSLRRLRAVLRSEMEALMLTPSQVLTESWLPEEDRWSGESNREPVTRQSIRALPTLIQEAILGFLNRP